MRAHVLDGDACWCLPELVLLDRGMVIVHRQPWWLRAWRRVFEQVALRPCLEPGCPTLVERGRCPAHRRAGYHQSDRKRPSSYERGYDRRWRRTSKAFLKVHDRCEWPGCTLPSTDADHKDGLGPLGPRGHDWDNLQALCHGHHSEKTATVDGGFGNPSKGEHPFGTGVRNRRSEQTFGTQVRYEQEFDRGDAAAVDPP